MPSTIAVASSQRPCTQARKNSSLAPVPGQCADMIVLITGAKSKTISTQHLIFCCSVHRVLPLPAAAAAMRMEKRRAGRAGPRTIAYLILRQRPLGGRLVASLLGRLFRVHIALGLERRRVA